MEVDGRGPYISLVMTAKKSGASPDEQRRYDEAPAMRRLPAGFVVHADQANQYPATRPSFEAIFTQQRQPTVHQSSQCQR